MSTYLLQYLSRSSRSRILRYRSWAAAFLPFGKGKRHGSSWPRAAGLVLGPEVFNTTNHTNFLLPNTSVDVAAGGSITSAYDARIMQFGLRYMF